MRQLFPPPDFTFDLTCRVLRELIGADEDPDLGRIGDAVEASMCGVVMASSSQRDYTDKERQRRGEQVVKQLQRAESLLGQLPPEVAATPRVQRIRAGVATLHAVFTGRSAPSNIDGLPPEAQKWLC